MGENRTFLLPVSLFWLSQFWFGRGEVEFSGDRDEERDPEDPWSQGHLERCGEKLKYKYVTIIFNCDLKVIEVDLEIGTLSIFLKDLQ